MPSEYESLLRFALAIEHALLFATARLTGALSAENRRAGADSVDHAIRTERINLAKQRRDVPERWLMFDPLPITASAIDEMRAVRREIEAAIIRALATEEKATPAPAPASKLPPPAHRRAVHAFAAAVARRPDLADDVEGVWRYIREEGVEIDGEEYHVPALDTFKRQLRGGKHVVRGSNPD